MKAVPYSLTTTRTRLPPAAPALTVPTRWVKFVVALFLLPVCAVLSQTFFTVFARAAVTHRLWAGEEFWFFSLGAVLWLIAFFGLPRPLLVYVFGHELTHALWVCSWAGASASSESAATAVTSSPTGTISGSRSRPIFSRSTASSPSVFTGSLSFFIDVQPYGRLLYAVIGVTWAFHFTFTCWMIPKSQTDLTDHGTFFSLVVIYLMNLLLLSVMLVLASRADYVR